jgi:dipeptidyl aminopeptidase/acylaminoacyl peptidase
MDISNTSDALQASVALMTKIGLCVSPSFSPDGARLTFVSNLSGLPQVWTVAAEGGWPTQVTALDDQIYGVAWSPDGDWLALSLAPGGGMNQQVYLVRPDGTGLRRLTDGGAENNWRGPWSHDGSRLAIASNRRTGAAMDVYLVDVATGAWQLVAQQNGIGEIVDISRDGQFVLLDRMANRGDNNLFLRDLGAGTEILLTPHAGTATFGGATFAPDRQTIYLSSNVERDLAAFARIAIAPNGRPGPIETLAARDDAELDHFAISEDGATAALVWNVAGRSQLAFMDLASGVLTPGPELPSELITQVLFSSDGRRLALNLSGATAPLDIWLLERESDKLAQVTHSPHAGIDLAALVRPELARFGAHDRLELSGWLYRPRGASAPGAVVLSFHGGPEGQERPGFNSTYQALLAQGISVFAPNVRGSSGFGKTFMNLDNGALRINAIADIQACVAYLLGAGVAEPGRIGIMGGSYGGYMTMAGLAIFPELFAAGANLFGVVNFETFFAHTEPWMAAISKSEYGDPETELDMLRELSPIHKLDRVKAATLVLHGANDTNVPVVEAEQVVERLKRQAVPVEYILFPDEGHGFTKTTNRIRSSVAVVRWFARYLLSGSELENHPRPGSA